jgi:hypothetical protein
VSPYSVLIALGALLPSAGVAFLFYLVMKAMLEGDRRERLAHTRWEAEQERATPTAGQSSNIDELHSSL